MFGLAAITGSAVATITTHTEVASTTSEMRGFALIVMRI